MRASVPRPTDEAVGSTGPAAELSTTARPGAGAATRNSPDGTRNSPGETRNSPGQDAQLARQNAEL
ncbi:MAG TPA: hypothetical protein VF667_06280, partial [Pseudonocardia sp.]